MRFMPRFRPVSVVLSAVLLSALMGGLFGPRLLATDEKIPSHYKLFTAALSAIESNYVDKVDSERLIYGAVRGMLGTLDPHSSFFDPREYAQMRERQEGRYYGLGISISTIDNYIGAVNVFEGSPAYKQGIRRGDIIWKIEGEETKGWTTQQAQNRLRGPKGTAVRIEIKRRGYADPISLTVTRDEVYLPTVQAYFMLDETTGYVRHKDWGENTDRDIRRALNELSGKGMKRLVYDIRTNPGGPLDQAIKVTNEFLPRGKMIVYTKGRIPNSDQDYRATEESRFTDLPMVVITNRSSASASEIFAGALQDHDRAVIVGETTFGKALVQSVYRITGGAGLALTTAHYYTPSGRLIQRPWDETFDEYLAYAQREPDVNRQHNANDLKRTAAGRPVYSGGGVEPDKYLPGLPSSDLGIGFNPTPFGRMLASPGRQAFENYAVKYMASADTRIAQKWTGRVELSRNFQVTDAMLEDFKEFLKSERIKVDEEAFRKDADFIKAMIRFRIDEAVFGVADAQRHLADVDPQVQLALTQFGEAQKLLLLSRSSNRAAQ
jgi:carboxyl-terminal processing protease